jgi:hypothetical protein
VAVAGDDLLVWDDVRGLVSRASDAALLAPGGEPVAGLVADATAAFVVRGDDVLEVPLAGGDPAPVLVNLGGLRGLALDGDAVYVGSLRHEAIFRIAR